MADMEITRYHSEGPEATHALAARLAGLLTPPCSLRLDGDMGAGKTVFVGGLAVGLGLEDRVVSPTFALAIEHRDAAARASLIHMDCWRIEDDEEFVAAGLEDYFAERGAVLAIEWAERIAGILPEGTLGVALAATEGRAGRRIRLALPAELSAALEAAIEAEPIAGLSREETR